jgi:cytochrome c peroxidase
MTRRRARLLGSLAAAAALLASGATLGASREPRIVGQKGKQFSEAKLLLQRGESIRFVNDDTVTHNVFSKSPIAPFNLKLQPPGSSHDIRFDEPGTATVRCAIHPMMKLEVTVEP